MRSPGVAGDTLPSATSREPLIQSRAAETFSTLIGEIYDAALDPKFWLSALDTAARFVGGTVAVLYSEDAARKSGEFYYDSGCIDPQSRRLYSEEYVRLDPTTTGHVFAEIEPMATADLIPYSEYVETRFYQDWARPHGLAFGVSAVFDKTAASAVLFGVFRNERDAAVDGENSAADGVFPFSRPKSRRPCMRV